MNGPSCPERRRPAGPYAYTSEQASLLLPFYRRFVWNPILPWIPGRVSPNALTVTGTACAAVACGLAVAVHDTNRGWLALSAVLVLTYLTLDNLDGYHARRTGRSSRLGEFLDHWLDTFNSGFVTMAVGLAVGMPRGVMLLVLVSANVAFFAVHWAHRHTGAMRMGKLADIEGTTAAAVILGAAALTAVHDWAVFGVGLALVMSLQSAWTAISFVAAVGVARQQWIPLCVGMVGAAVWAATSPPSFWPALILLALLNPLCTGRTIAARVGAAPARRLDLVVVSVVCAGGLLAAWPGASPVSGPMAAWACVVLAAVCAAFDLAHGLRVLRAGRGTAVPATVRS